MAETAQPQPIPIPANFPVKWRKPDDVQMFWFQDAMHLPQPLSPLDATLYQQAFAEGATQTISQMSMPISGFRAEVFNGYTYLGALPVMGTPEEMDARFQEMIRITGELGSTVLADWRATFEPKVLAECDEVFAFDYANRPPTGSRGIRRGVLRTDRPHLEHPHAGQYPTDERGLRA